MKPGRWFGAWRGWRAGWLLFWLILGAVLTGCRAPIGADKAPVRLVYRQTHENAVSRDAVGSDTLAVLHRFGQIERFAQSPDDTLRRIHRQAVESRDRSLLFALAELNFLAGERLRRSVKPWEPRDPRDYYLASAVYSWFFLFGEAADPPPGPFDQRFRAACDLYNHGLGWAFTQRRGTNGVVLLESGTRKLPFLQLEVELKTAHFPWPVDEFESFVAAQQFLVRGLSVRNRQAGLGAPLVAVTRKQFGTGLSRCLPATLLLRVDGGLADLEAGNCNAALELYCAFDTATVDLGRQQVPLETDTTVPLAYALNQSMPWRLGLMQFMSFKEQVPSDVYLIQPYQPGKIPVVLVHGTFSSPVSWTELVNTLSADPELRQRCQFWWFIYNSGFPTTISAVRLREALAARVKELDPAGEDAALKQMVVIGHSQGGLLTKLTATDTGEELLRAVLKTNRLEDLGVTGEQKDLVQRYTHFEALPFVKRVIFISTPHRGSYLASGFARRLARRVVALPSRLVQFSKEFAGLEKKLDLPRGFRGAATSLDSMSTRNPVQLALADIPLKDGVKGHSIIAVQGKGDWRKGKDGLVAYESAHVKYVESELIVRGPHSCQNLAPCIEEVRRILREHVGGSEVVPVRPAARRASGAP